MVSMKEPFSPTDLQQPSPAPHLKCFQFVGIYFHQGPGFGLHVKALYTSVFHDLLLLLLLQVHGHSVCSFLVLNAHFAIPILILIPL